MKKIFEILGEIFYLFWYLIVFIACFTMFSITGIFAIIYLDQINPMGNLFADFLFYCVIVASVAISHLITRYTFDK